MATNVSSALKDLLETDRHVHGERVTALVRVRREKQGVRDPQRAVPCVLLCVHISQKDPDCVLQGVHEVR